MRVVRAVNGPIAGVDLHPGAVRLSLARRLTEEFPDILPLALSRAHRAQTARELLTSTSLHASDVAFASGFGSIRQFNDTIRAVYERSPLELRAAPELELHRRRPGVGAGRRAERSRLAVLPRFPSTLPRPGRHGQGQEPIALRHHGHNFIHLLARQQRPKGPMVSGLAVSLAARRQHGPFPWGLGWV